MDASYSHPSQRKLDETLLRARAALGDGDYEAAEELARSVGRHDLECVQARLFIALASFQRERFRVAAVCLCKLGASVGCAVAYEIAGDIHLRDDRLQDAFERYTDAH